MKEMGKSGKKFQKGADQADLHKPSLLTGAYTCVWQRTNQESGFTGDGEPGVKPSRHILILGI